jgi:hypothetical protein
LAELPDVESPDLLELDASLLAPAVSLVVCVSEPDFPSDPALLSDCESVVLDAFELFPFESVA